MTIIYLVRHAENDFVGKRLAGRLPDVHLNERGRTQAADLASSLARVRLRGLYSSPIERTLETAEPIAQAQGLPVLPREGLGEILYGRWQGKTLKSLRRRKLWRVVQQSPSLMRFPEGETFAEAQLRVVNELEMLCSQHPGPKAIIACVSHADTIKLAIAHYLGLPIDLFRRLTVSPASISVLSIHDGFARLQRLNDTSAITSPAGG